VDEGSGGLGHRPHATVRADAEILELGRTLAVVEVRLFSEDRPEVVARASVTYAIPR